MKKGKNPMTSTGKTDRINSPEKVQNVNEAETEALRKKAANKTTGHQEGNYDKQSDKDEMDPGYVKKG
jgi:hypothetical protein